MACDNRSVTPTRDEPPTRFLTLDEVAELLRIDDATALALVERAELPALRVGDDGPWRVERDVLEQFIDDRYEAQRRASRTWRPGDDDLPELWGDRIPEDDGLPPAPLDAGPANPGPHLHLVDAPGDESRRP